MQQSYTLLLYNSQIIIYTEKKSVSAEEKTELKKMVPLIESWGKEELGSEMVRLGVKSPVSGNEISEPMEFNLMFKSEIGPTGQFPAFLRPETAQG